MTRQLETVLAQIKSGRQELNEYPPDGFKWYDRCVKSAKLLVPWLVEIAPALKKQVEEVINSPQLVRKTWTEIKSTAAKHLPPSTVELMDRELEKELVLLAFAGGDAKSKVIETFLIENFQLGKLESNGKSDYPDLFLRTNDYSGLPRTSRKASVYGAALKSKTLRPVRVPDGLEIKTCKGRFAVDCHDAHRGLHLVMLFSGVKNELTVRDFQIAYLSKADYRMTDPKSSATTLKASFGGVRFVSLFDNKGGLFDE